MDAHAGTDRDIADRVAEVGGSRWWFVAYGVLGIIVGIAVLAMPGLTLLALAVLFAVQLFVLGLFRIVAAFAVPDSSGGVRVLSIVIGILSVVVGVFCLRSPVQTIVVLTLVLGAFWLVNGIVQIVSGIAGAGMGGRGWLIVGGLIGVLGGIVVLSAPVTSAVTLAWLLGILLIADGVVVMISGFSRPAGRRTTGPVDPVASSRPAPDPARDERAPTSSV